MDNNQIKEIRNIRGMRKLRVLTLRANKISNLSSIVFTEPSIELREVDFSGNKLRVIEALRNIPNIEELDLSGNPIKMVFPEAFSGLSSLHKLNLSDTRFKTPYDGDLMFLRPLSSTLIELRMDKAFPKENLELVQHAFPLMKFEKL